MASPWTPLNAIDTASVALKDKFQIWTGICQWLNDSRASTSEHCEHWAGLNTLALKMYTSSSLHSPSLATMLVVIPHSPTKELATSPPPVCRLCSQEGSPDLSLFIVLLFWCQIVRALNSSFWKQQCQLYKDHITSFTCTGLYGFHSQGPQCARHVYIMSKSNAANNIFLIFWFRG